MGPRMALTQRLLKIGDQFLRGQQLGHDLALLRGSYPGFLLGATLSKWSPTGKPVALSRTPMGRNPERKPSGQGDVRVEGSHCLGQRSHRQIPLLFFRLSFTSMALWFPSRYARLPRRSVRLWLWTKPILT